MVFRPLRGVSLALPFLLITGGMLLAYNLVSPNPAGKAVLYCAIGACTASALTLGMLLRLHRPARPWVLLALSMAVWSVGDITWFLADVNGQAPYPSSSDAFFLVGYALLGAGLLGIITAGRRKRAVVADLIDVAIISVSITLATWSVVFEPTFAEGWSASAAVSAAYAGGDILLLGLLGATYFNPLKRTAAVALLGGGVMAIFLADVTYYVPFFASSSTLEAWSNHSWLVGYILIGAAGLQRSRSGVSSATHQSAFGQGRLFLVGASLLALPSALVLDAVVADGIQAREVMIFSVGFVLVIGLLVSRAWILVREIEEWRLRSEQTRLRFQTIFESAGVGILIPDTDYNGRMGSTNSALQDMLGYSSAELKQIRYIDLVHPDEVEAARAFSGIGPGTRAAVDRRFIRRDGKVALGRVTLTTAPDESFRIAVIEDITEKAGIERQQQEAQRLEAIGRLAGGIAHDFNNLLTGVVGHAELIRTATSPGEVEQSVEVILDASGRAAELVRQLLTFSRQQDFRAEEIETGDLLRRTANLLRRILGSAVRVEVDIQAGAPHIVADPSQIDQVLLNLAVNARDAMPDGGTLSLSVGAFTHDGSDNRYAAALPGDYCRILVADTGMGMSEATTSRILEPFFTTKEVGKGTGLGLAITHGIIARAHGHLLVSSTLGEGTTFEILLPASQAQSEPTREPLLLAS